MIVSALTFDLKAFFGRGLLARRRREQDAVIEEAMTIIGAQAREIKRLERRVALYQALMPLQRHREAA